MNTAFAAVVCALLVAASAHAVTPEAEANALVAEGARLGEAGAFDEAIARFRAAERVLPRAIHDCNLGLTYAMARRFPEAHALLARCVARATGPLPGWVDSERRRVLAELTRGPYTSVVIATTPAATLQLTPLLPDDSFTAPLTAWLSVGEHEITARAEGHRVARRRVVVTGRDALQLQLVLEPASLLSLEPRPPEREDGFADRALPSSPAVRDQVPGWAVLSSGLVSLAVGAVFHGLAASTQTAIAGRDYATQSAADGDLDVYDAQVGAMAGAYSVGAVLVLTGVGLLIWPPALDASP